MNARNRRSKTPENIKNLYAERRAKKYSEFIDRDGGDSSRLPGGDSQIFRSYAFGPLGLKDYGSATLRCKI